MQKNNYYMFRDKIEQLIRLGKKNFVFYPFGIEGMDAKKILNEQFGIEESFIVDNKLAKFNSNIKSVEELSNIDTVQYTFLITNNNPEIYEDIRNTLKKYVPQENIEELFPIVNGNNDCRYESLRLMAEIINSRKNMRGGLWQN